MTFSWAKYLVIGMLTVHAILLALDSTEVGFDTIRFVDVTHEAGIHFVHTNGATANKHLPETMGSGCAFVDLDGDGWPDILLLNGRNYSNPAQHTRPALYRNNRNGTFTDITSGSGLDVEMYAMGVAVADYDNDGLPDIYITALEGDRLFHNEGHDRFKDVTAESGIRNADFGTSVAWFDYDRDGKADLFVANYVKRDTSVRCSHDGGATLAYCAPQSFKGTVSKLYHNLGGGRFEDVTAKAGLSRVGKSLGVAVFDFNGDGWPDLFVANDTEPNKLYRNNGDGTFTEMAVEAGIAYGQNGAARAGMGVDAADYDHVGRPHLLVGNFSNEMLGLYHNDGKGLFVDQAPSSIVGHASRLSLTFGVFFFDYDLDGYQDIFAANGHIEPDINRIQPNVQYPEAPLLFHNQGHGQFENASNSVGPDFTHPLVARGAAYADFDHDGAPDILISTNGGPAVLYRNEGNRNNWINIRLSGTKSNRSALGAVVRIDSALGEQWQTVHSGSSYCSQSDLALTFGLAQDRIIGTLTVDWPSGIRQQFENQPVKRFLKIDESLGIVSSDSNISRESYEN